MENKKTEQKIVDAYFTVIQDDKLAQDFTNLLEKLAIKCIENHFLKEKK